MDNAPQPGKVAIAPVQEGLIPTRSSHQHTPRNPERPIEPELA
jgi:hypothetical protein